MIARCLNCKKYHLLADDRAFLDWQDWLVKHHEHQVDFLVSTIQSDIEDFAHNADNKVAYGSSAAYAIDLSGLATSSSLIAGRQGTAISNTSGLYLDYLVGGKITMGTVAPTAEKTIEIWAYGSVNDTPTYPDTITGTDGNVTLTSGNVKSGSLKLVERLFVDASASRVYWFGPISLLDVFRGRIPKNHGLWVVQDSGQSLHSTAGNHVLNYTPVYETVS